ncbi:MAG: hypothetical protein KatS3mg104_1379 [Phycisphaerae bacterium]|nr:MAG: hypothetical protein KatS3mg104_1379 [Phycisphaerae bacterium]
MISSSQSISLDRESSIPSKRAEYLFSERLAILARQCDRTFILLMVAQWAGAILIACYWSPRTWQGTTSFIHPHLLAAVILGGLLSGFPIYFAIRHPGTTVTRVIITVSQMSYSSLLIHLTGGRIETHFHVFGSLAFLAWYLDRRMLLLATLITTVDHAVRGAFWPETIYGVLSAGPWRTIEHAVWVMFEDIFLIIAIQRNLKELRENASLQAYTEQEYERIDREVQSKTREIAEKNVFLDKVGEIAGVGGWRLDLQTMTPFWTACTRALHGVDDDYQPTLESAIAFYAPEARALVRKEVQKAIECGTGFDFDAPMIRADGKHIYVRVLGAVEFENGRPVRLLGAIQDITRHREMEQQLRDAAYRDKLTGLANRALLMEHLTKAIQTHQENPEWSYAVLFLDFDRFKMVNDSLGHETGDELLREIAQRLRWVTADGSISHRDGPVATPYRLGGDEFVILLQGCHAKDHVTRIAETALEVLRQPYQIRGHEIVSTGSIGIVIAGYGHERAEDVLRDADTAMYRAKSAGKDRYMLFNERMHTEALRRLETESALRRALERQELFLNYQPIVALRDGRIAGFEALIRWRRDGRIIQPDEFIPVAEDTGMILPIGRWVIEQAIQQLSVWRAEYPSDDLSMAINLSRKQLIDRELIPCIRRVLEHCKVPPAAVKMEITESMVMEKTDSVLQTIRSLHEIGVKVSMDDFGTGHSSLASLHEFPIDILKLDRLFMQNLCLDLNATAVVNATLTLAHHLGLKVVAEGLETPEQVAVLQSLDCDFVQGYLFSKPLSSNAVEQLLKDKQHLVIQKLLLDSGKQAQAA